MKKTKKLSIKVTLEGHDKQSNIKPGCYGIVRRGGEIPPQIMAVFDPKTRRVGDLLSDGHYFYVPRTGDDVGYANLALLERMLRYEESYRKFRAEYDAYNNAGRAIGQKGKEYRDKSLELRRKAGELEKLAESADNEANRSYAHRDQLQNPLRRSDGSCLLMTATDNRLQFATNNGHTFVCIGCKEIPIDDYKRIIGEMKKLSARK